MCHENKFSTSIQQQQKQQQNKTTEFKGSGILYYKFVWSFALKRNSPYHFRNKH
jgi:hypothetical protein